MPKYYDHESLSLADFRLSVFSNSLRINEITWFNFSRLTFVDSKVKAWLADFAIELSFCYPNSSNAFFKK